MCVYGLKPPGWLIHIVGFLFVFCLSLSLKLCLFKLFSFASQMQT